MSDGTHPQRPFEGNIMRFESANIARSRDATRAQHVPPSK
jgi:hypothetical protein